MIELQALPRRSPVPLTTNSLPYLTMRARWALAMLLPHRVERLRRQHGPSPCSLPHPERDFAAGLPVPNRRRPQRKTHLHILPVLSLTSPTRPSRRPTHCCRRRSPTRVSRLLLADAPAVPLPRNARPASAPPQRDFGWPYHPFSSSTATVFPACFFRRRPHQSHQQGRRRRPAPSHARDPLVSARWVPSRPRAQKSSARHRVLVPIRVMKTRTRPVQCVGRGARRATIDRMATTLSRAGSRRGAFGVSPINHNPARSSADELPLNNFALYPAGRFPG